MRTYASLCVKYSLFQQQADGRVKQCNELIQGIKVIKLLAWEFYQSKTITDIRDKEVKLLFKLAAFRAMFSKY